MIIEDGVCYMTQDEVAVALEKSSSWVRDRIKDPDPERRLSVYKGKTTGRGKRNLFLPGDVADFKKKLTTPPQKYIPFEEDPRELFSLSEVAARLDVTRAYIWRRIQSGNLRAINFARPGTKRPIYKVPREELLYILEHGWRDPEKDK